MKKQIYLSVFFLFMGFMLTAQQDTLKWPSLDVSPMDRATYPRTAAFGNYLDEDDPNKQPKIKVYYSRPYKKDRVIFGDLVKYGEDWRLGANEGTEVTFYQNVELEGVVIPRGQYRLYAEVNQDKWDIVVSSHTNTAGMRNMDKTKELGRFKAMTSKTDNVREQFTIGFQKIDEGNVHMLFEWDNVRATLPINLNAASLAGKDASPMDMAFYPPRSRFLNFVKAEELEANQPKIRVVYARPQMKERKIFGELLPYGEMWRLGANETTRITFYSPVMIGDKELRPGTYGLFAMVNPNSWDIIIHTNVDSWGPANHDEETNMHKITIPTGKTKVTVEALSVVFDKISDNHVDVVFGWENTLARLPVKIK